MNYLAIDTSSKNLTIVINYNDKLHKFFDQDCGVNHSVSLMQRLEDLVEENGVDLSKIDFFVSVIGAGSFTGIRIGVSTIKAFCIAYNKPVLSITSFDTLAYNKQNGKVLAVIDAKHNGFYVCGYQDLNVVLPPQYIDGERLRELSCEYQLISATPIEGINCQQVCVLQGLITAIESKKHLISADIESLVPLYVLKSQAEENR